MPVITISATFGAGAKEVGQLVAERLNIGYVDRETLVEAACNLGIPATSMAGREDKPSTFGERLSGMLRNLLERSATAGPADPFVGAAGLEILLNRTYSEAAAGTPEDTRYHEILAAVVLDLARDRSVVIIGRGGQAILASDETALHVLLDAPLPVRVQRIMERDEVSREDAEHRIREADRARREFHHKYFKVDPDDLGHYHLAVNTGRHSDAQAAELIASASRLRQPHPG